jgi:hypothetical protein
VVYVFHLSTRKREVNEPELAGEACDYEVKHLQYPFVYEPMADETVPNPRNPKLVLVNYDCHSVLALTFASRYKRFLKRSLRVYQHDGCSKSDYRSKIAFIIRPPELDFLQAYRLPIYTFHVLGTNLDLMMSKCFGR